LAAIILDDPDARDSGGNQQAGGFNIPVDRNNGTNPGWFSEASVQSILYDLYDADPDGVDTVEAGFAPIYNTLIEATYTGSPYFTTIFLFADEYKKLNASTSAGLDALLGGQSINGTGPDGAGETNTGNIQASLPVYKTATQGGAPFEICSVDDAGVDNKLGVFSYIEFTPTATGNYTFNMTRTSGDTARDPDFVFYINGIGQFAAESGATDSEVFTRQLTAGTEYKIIAYDWHNTNGVNASQGDSCFNFSVN